MKKIQNSYKKSGVNISLANKLVKHISLISKKDVKKTKNSINKDVIGGFGSLFDISKLNIKDPVIVSCTDGVGTKIELANKFKKFDTIGIDLVAMCINDLIVQGAKPLFFLDYISTNKINFKKMKSIIHGILDVLVDGKKVGSMRDGEVFGEMALILKQNRSATIISSQSSELITISKENLDELISSGSKAAQEVIINL